MTYTETLQDPKGTHPSVSLWWGLLSTPREVPKNWFRVIKPSRNRDMIFIMCLLWLFIDFIICSGVLTVILFSLLGGKEQPEGGVIKPAFHFSKPFWKEKHLWSGNRGPENILKFISAGRESLTPHHFRVNRTWGAQRTSQGGTSCAKREMEINLTALDGFSGHVVSQPEERLARLLAELLLF